VRRRKGKHLKIKSHQNFHKANFLFNILNKKLVLCKIFLLIHINLIILSYIILNNYFLYFNIVNKIKFIEFDK
jgi:hypothetical protein